MPLRIRCAIVDDEALARRKLRDLLAGIEGVEIVGEAADGVSAVRLLTEYRPELVFLDIRIPELSGFAVLERLDYSPHVIFTTAFDQFAVPAFDVDAVDYLLKPFSASRLRLAFARAVEGIRDKDRSGAAQRAASVGDRLFVRANGQLVAIAISSIERIEGSDDYSSVHANGRTYLVSRRLSFFEAALESAGFLRVHRSHIVNRNHLTGVRIREGGRLEAHLASGAVVTVSRSRASALRAALKDVRQRNAASEDEPSSRASDKESRSRRAADDR